jgi:low affinity Fe/Cu permease
MNAQPGRTRESAMLETGERNRADVRIDSLFRHFAGRTAAVVGSPWAFLLAVASVVVWALLGPHFKWSSAHQLVINTFTTIVTFLIVFLIQNTQNRDTKSLHLKIDELLKATRGARNSMIDLDSLTDEQLAKLEKEFKALCGDDAREPQDRMTVEATEPPR